jgi:hypothetical protein
MFSLVFPIRGKAVETPIYIRIRRKHGTQQYAPVVKSGNGKIKQLYAHLDGRDVLPVSSSLSRTTPSHPKADFGNSGSCRAYLADVDSGFICLPSLQLLTLYIHADTNVTVIP